MKNLSKWHLTEEEKEKYMANLYPQLMSLRARAKVSQEELANIIGVSRQTYGALERKTQRMTWNTFVSLVMFYDYNVKTHEMLRQIGAFPVELIKRFNDGDTAGQIEVNSFLNDDMKNIAGVLDEQALRSIRTMIMVEYARCTNAPSDVMMRAFEGILVTNTNPSETKKRAAKAFKSIKEQKRTDGKK